MSHKKVLISIVNVKRLSCTSSWCFILKLWLSGWNILYHKRMSIPVCWSNKSGFALMYLGAEWSRLWLKAQKLNLSYKRSLEWQEKVLMHIRCLYIYPYYSKHTCFFMYYEIFVRCHFVRRAFFLYYRNTTWMCYRADSGLKKLTFITD